MKLPLITLAAFAIAPGHSLTPAASQGYTACSGVCSRTAAPTVTGVSVVPATGHADVVIGVQSPVEIQDFTLDAPYRVVVDIKGASLAETPSAYDKVARGGITDVRVSQFSATVVRVVLQLDGSHPYQVQRGNNEVRIAISGGSGGFASWTGLDGRAADRAREDARSSDDASPSIAPPRSTMTVVSQPSYLPSVQQSTQPRITVTYQDADIRDVIAAFATFAGRTIVTGRDVTGTVTAEIRNQPWDVALRAILQGQGLAASEDPASGIITVDSYANVQARQAFEPLVTQLIPVNYAKADSLVPVVTKLLAKDCVAGGPASAAGGTGSGAATSFGNQTCITRGAVASNPGTNTLIVTETPSRIAGIINYVEALDVRTPQVSIKAKIVFVDRTNIEDLGLSYDLGTQNQFFSTLAPRIDPTTLKPITNADGVPIGLGGGTPVTGNRIALGGNTLSGIADANNRIASPALQLVYSAALGHFSLTSFLDALQEVRLADLQAEPSIVTVDNRQANIQVGQDIPVRVLDLSTQQSGAAGAVQPKATVSFHSVGIILQVTPHITNNHQVLLDVHAENSDAQLAGSDIGYVFNKQSADNRLLVNDGETAVIGGLTVTQVTQSKSGIPVLVDLPLVGKLFGVTQKSEEKRDLLILITPHVIDDGERVRSTRER
ncbi:MAG TPA: AMIN domain-containing protein [Gemmatimonadaceae bacterium]|nr:AMIN domain-containing protein [Gemmatimonadaceae bacterium]